MHIGLIISALLHAAILGWAVITIQTQRELRVAEPEPVAIDLVSPSEMTKLRQGSRTAKQMEATAKEGPPPEVVRKEAPKPSPTVVKQKAEPPPEVKEEPKPDPPKEVAKAEPKVEPKPEPKVVEPVKDPIAEKLATDNPDPALEQAKLEEKLREEQKKAEEQKRLEEQKKAEDARKAAELKKKLDDEKKRKAAELKKKLDEEKKRKEAEAKKKFNPEELAALLNKVPDKGAPLTSTPSEVPTKNKGPILGAKEGRDTQLSASELAQLKGLISTRLRACWRLPSGGGGSDTPVVTLRWRMHPDGSVDGIPEVVEQRGDALFRVAADAARRAVQECSPFPLPRDKYNSWRTITWEFDPSQIL